RAAVRDGAQPGTAAPRRPRRSSGGDQLGHRVRQQELPRRSEPVPGGQTTGPRARRTRLPGHAAHVGTGLPPVGGDGTDAADDAPPPGASQGTAEVSPAGRSITARVPVLGWRPAWFSDGVWQQAVAISPATAAHLPSVTAGGRGTRGRHGRDSEGAPHGEGRPTRRGAPHPPRGTPPAEGHPTRRGAPHTAKGTPHAEGRPTRWQSAPAAAALRLRPSARSSTGRRGPSPAAPR